MLLRTKRPGNEQGRHTLTWGDVGGRKWKWKCEIYSDRTKLRDLLTSLLIKKTKAGEVRGRERRRQSDKVAFFWVRSMPLISLEKRLMDCRQLTSKVPGNKTWLVNEEQHSSLGKSSSPGALAVHEVVSSVLLVHQKQNHIWLNLLDCGWIDLHRLLLSSLAIEKVLHVMETALSFPLYHGPLEIPAPA